MRYCKTCSRREDRHNVRHPFIPWLGIPDPVPVAPTIPALPLCDREPESMGSE